MTSDWVASFASVATLVVIAVTAYAALRQMRHMRSGTQVAALIPLMEQYTSHEMVDSRQYVFRQLKNDLHDPVAREGAFEVPCAGRTRQALPLLNFYEECGALVCARVLDLELVLRYFMLPSDVWSMSREFVAISRRASDDELFEHLEALVAMELRYVKRHGTSLYPKNLPHVSTVETVLLPKK